MTRKFLNEMLDEARSKDQQIKGQQAMLDQKIKAEYDSITKDIPRRKKKITTGTGGSPYQVYKAPPAGNYVPAPKRVSEGWSSKYKKSIDCNNPKGFSQRAHCQGRKKKKL